MTRLLPFLLLSCLLPLAPCSQLQAARPNILWFVVDDMSANFSCYGEKLIQTPAVDKLAAEGTKLHPRLRHCAGVFTLPLGTDHRHVSDQHRRAHHQSQRAG